MGRLRKVIKKGNAFFLRFDLSHEKLSELNPMIANQQSLQINSEVEIIQIIDNVCDKLKIPNEEKWSIQNKAKNEIPKLWKVIEEKAQNISLLPDHFTGTLYYGDNINCSTNFNMPQIFKEFAKELFLVGINFNFLLNLEVDSTNFIIMLQELMNNPKKIINICISNLWEPNLLNAYNLIIFNQSEREMEGLTKVFHKQDSEYYIDSFIRSKTGNKYEQVCSQLKIRAVKTLGDTFWFVDTNEVSKTGNMLLMPMTASTGLERSVFFANQKRHENLYKKYYTLCKGAFDNAGVTLWPKNTWN
jgi:hypothetical protein